MGEAHQDPEQNSHRILGSAHLPRRHRPPPQGVRRPSGRVLSRELHPGPFLAQRPPRIPYGGFRYGIPPRQGRHRILSVLGFGHMPPDDRCHAPASLPILRRLVRRELSQHRTLRRCHHGRAHPRNRVPIPHHPEAVRPRPVRRIDGRMDLSRPPGLPPRFLRRHVVALSRPCRFPILPDRQHL